MKGSSGQVIREIVTKGADVHDGYLRCGVYISGNKISILICRIGIDEILIPITIIFNLVPLDTAGYGFLRHI